MRLTYYTALLAGLSIANVGAIEYDPSTGDRVYYYAAASYCGDQVQNWKCGKPCTDGPQVTEVVQLSKWWDGTFAFVGYNAKDDEIAVAFRGSVDIANWISNIEIEKKIYPGVPGAEVHTGFYNAYMNLQDQMFKAIKDIKSRHPSAGIVITGHSLGASMATLAAAAIKTTLNFDRITFYTFGSPRTGNQAFADYIFSLFPNGGYSRITHYNDVVVHLPQNFLGFYHTGDEVFYEHPSDLTHKTCKNFPGQGENKNCANSMWATGIDAHLHYLDHPLSSAACANGGPVLPEHMRTNGTTIEVPEVNGIEEIKFLSQ